MLEITLEVPETLTRLPEQERDRLVRAGLHEATRARIHQLESEIAQSRAEVDRFEARYGMSLARFETEVLARRDGIEVHNDYNDWFYWQSVLEEKQKLLGELQAVEIA